MKIPICFLFTLFFSVAVVAQNDTDQIKEVFDSYRSLIEQKEYDKAFDFYRADFLKYIPKADLKKQFAAIDDPGRVEYSVLDSKLIFVSEILKEGDMKYAFLRYSSIYNFKFNENIDDSTMNRIKAVYDRDYGSDYSYHKRSKTITVYKEQELIIIKEEDWRFIVYKQKLDPYMNIWIPKNIFSELLIKRQGKNILND